MSAPAGSTADGPIVGSVADHRYAIPLGAMLQSALANLRPDRTLSVHLVDMGLAPSDRERLTALAARHHAALEWHDGDGQQFKSLPVSKRMTTATYARLALPQLLPDVRKLIWLDADVLVDADLDQLWHSDVEGDDLLAVQDPCVPHVSSRYGIRRWRELGLPEQAKYFNAGVMLLNLERWRANDVCQRVYAYLRDHHDECWFWDQDGLNAVLCGCWGELDLRWNYCEGFTPRERRDARELEPWIIHFTGRLKPWLLPRTTSGARGLFYRRLDQTPWAGWEPRGTAAARARGWYEQSHVRDVLYPAEHWLLLYASNRIRRAAAHVGSTFG